MPSAADALFMVEGCSQGLLGANWGDGFHTDPLAVAALNNVAPGSDPNPFFRQLLRASYRCRPLPLEPASISLLIKLLSPVPSLHTCLSACLADIRMLRGVS